jgi:hypothetical protein
MWPVGIGLKLYWAVSGIDPAAHSVPSDFEPIHFFGPVPYGEITAALIPLSLLIALGIVGAYLILRRSLGDATAVVAGLLLALSPYYLAQSKILHLEAAMATLMLLSALALLVYRRERQGCWVILAGVLGGLALLVKIPALFLFPFTGLVLLVDVVRTGQRRPRNLRTVVRGLALPLVLWGLAAVVVYCAFWPVMWVAPGRGLAAVRWGLSRHATTAHDSPTLFMGQVTRGDPGPLFYVVALLFRTSEVELTFLIVAALLGIVSLLRHRFASPAWKGQIAPTAIDLLLLAAYAIFYLAQMSLGAKKMPRYILPALLVLDVLAATAVVAWARRLAGARRWLRMGLMALPVLIQAVLILPRHPVYGTALNWLAGGPPAASRAILIGEEGEGYTELAEYLNARPDARRLTVAAQLKHVFNQTFHGATVDIDKRRESSDVPADYLAFHRNYTARDYKIDQWGRLWERYAPRSPEREIRFDGVPYAWLYPVLAPDAGPENDQVSDLGEGFRFLGYDLRESQVEPGDQVPIVLYWQATEPVTENLSIFLHLLDPAGRLVWQSDGAADHGDRPTWSWGPGEMISDPHTLLVPRDQPEGEYLLMTGLYDWQTGERLPVLGSDGIQMAGDRVPVATLGIRQPQTHPAAWAARGMSLLVVLSALAQGLRLRGCPPSDLGTRLARAGACDQDSGRNES